MSPPLGTKYAPLKAKIQTLFVDYLDLNNPYSADFVQGKVAERALRATCF